MLINEKTIWTPDNSYLLQYKAEIECGNIIAGRELIMELENLAEDLREEELYFYDRTDALLRMDFMENCIKLTKSPFYGKPMKLMLWQKAYIEALYSFKMTGERTEDGKMIDRFRRSLLLIARKNAKSETCSGIANSEFITGNEGADIVCSSNDDAQASIIFDSINTMRQLYDPEDLDTKKNIQYILNKNTNTKIYKLSDRTKNKEGRNIDFAVLDEAHEMKTNEIAKSIEQSQSVKDNPKFIIITTEGFIKDGYLDGELQKARAIIKGEDDSISARRFLPWLYTQDSEAEVFRNPKSWAKSNPSLGTIKKVSYLEEQIDLARKSKADRIFVLSKDFNFKQSSVEAWLNSEDYDYRQVYDLEEFRGCHCLGHVDLAETTDLCCAKALVMKPGDKTKYIITQYFIPERKLLPKYDDHIAGAKYKEWAKDGYITVCEGNEIDLAVVADWYYLKLFKEYGIILYKSGYDQRFAKDWLARMDEYGWNKKYGDVEMILQNAQTLNNAILLTEAELKEKRINYNNNPVDKWCFENSCLKLNDLRQALVVKTDNQKKIDGTVTLVSLMEMYRRYKNEFLKLVGGGEN